jgi:hypothetical protein
MWSSKYTGRRGVVSDQFQRIIVRVHGDEFLDTFPLLLQFVTHHSLRHILLEYDLSYHKTKISSLISQLKELREMTTPEKLLHCTIEVLHYEVGNQEIKTIIEEIQPAVISVGRSLSRSQTVEAANDLASLISDAKLPIAIGISGLLLPDIQYCIDGNPQIALVNVGSFPPNIHVHAIEFCHSRGRNALVDLMTLDSSSLPSSVSVTRCAEKYALPPSVILAKTILQLGALLSVPSEFLRDDRTFLPILRLNHPFTFLQTAFDPSNLTRLVFTNDEIEDISAEFLLAETAHETAQLSRYITRPHGRQLRNLSTVGLSAANGNLKHPKQEKECVSEVRE